MEYKAELSGLPAQTKCMPLRYKVEKGTTIAQVTKAMGSDWQTIKKLNPQAVGRSKANGNWFVREGAVLTNDKASNFASVLQTTTEEKTKTPRRPGPNNGSSTAQTKQQTHTVKPGETVWGLATKTYHVDPSQVLSDNGIKDAAHLQVGQKITIPDTSKTTEKQTVVASWYGKYHHGQPMANGKPYNMYAATIAHKDIPLGTKVLLENPDTGQKVTATVTDRGPYIKGRDVDLSFGLAQRLSVDKLGVSNLTMQIL